ncbi:MAG: hypothetical protein AUK44_07900 [Porphyromonadaceae bacterium CG2_30_38_12]|nr:MAG: hypothetical protein AUK44_07900 [Porphyromonadaceae bacterium CG2_30_38_12]
MEFLKQLTFQRSSNTVYLQPISQLYLNCFSLGESAQYVDSVYLQQYLCAVLTTGKSLMFFNKQQLIACLLYAPLTIDTDCPKQIVDAFRPTNCAYIAEIMVDEQYRGKGLGKKLLKEFYNTVDSCIYQHAFIRVWDKNTAAIGLYQKMGFEPYTTIEQQKISADGITPFSMHKIYLYKSLELV